VAGQMSPAAVIVKKFFRTRCWKILHRGRGGLFFVSKKFAGEKKNNKFLLEELMIFFFEKKGK
jgi:hypothetical protein